MSTQVTLDSSKFTPKERTLFIKCNYCFFVNGILALMVGALLPFIRSEYNLSYEVAGFLVSAHSIGNLISSFIGGILPLKIGRKQSILLLCCCGPVGFVLVTLTNQPVILILAFFLSGINRGAVSNFSNTTVNDIATGKAWALNILHSIFSIGAFIAPFIALGFTSKSPNYWIYASLFLAFMLLTEFIVYATMNIPNNYPAENKKEKQKSNWGFLKIPKFLVACGILISYLGAEQAINGWLVTYLKDTGIMSSSFAQIMTSILWILMLCGRLLTAKISQKVNNAKILVVNGVGYLIFSVILIMSRTFLPAAIGVMGVGFFMAAIYPTTMAGTGYIAKEYPIALSFLLTFAGLGSILMPTIIGVISERIGIFGGMGTIIVAVIISFVLILYNYIMDKRGNKI